MSIPYQPNKPKLIPLKETVMRDNARFINEAAHAFEKQYEISHMVAERIYDAILQDETELSIPFKGEYEHYIFGGTNITIGNHTYFNTSGRIVSFSEDEKGLQWPNIEIHPHILIMKKEKESAIKEIAGVVAHELTHAYVTYKYEVSKLKRDNPERSFNDYEKYVEIIRTEGEKIDSLLYSFCYAMYSTYYQEMQAFVSQTYYETLKILDDMYGTYEVSNDQFRRAIMRTNTYLTYSQNAHTAKELMKDGSTRERLASELKKHGIKISGNEILTKAKKIWTKSISTLGNAYNNAYHYIFNL